MKRAMPTAYAACPFGVGRAAAGFLALFTAYVACPFGVGQTASGADAECTPDQFRKVCAGKAEELRKAGAAGLAGQDGYYFFVNDLHHYGAGPFWGADAARASLSEDKERADPLPAILDFHAQCRKAGVTLILVPVPGKAVVYPDKLDPALRPKAGLDAVHQAFYELLRKDGLEVIDLLPDFLALRQKGVDTHCKQDSHWSPAGMQCAATRIAEIVQRNVPPGKQPWSKDVPGRQEVKRTPEMVECNGDIVKLMKLTGIPAEELNIEIVAWKSGQEIESDSKSPLLLTGDSHGLVYHMSIEDGIPAQGAGLFEHLAGALGFAPELLTTMGSGANIPRTDLARRRDNLAGRKCLVWCFTVREFTASAGWSKIPVVR